MRQEQQTNEQPVAADRGSYERQDWEQLSMDFRRHGERIEALYTFLYSEGVKSTHDWRLKPEEQSIRQAEVMKEFIELLGDRFPEFLDRMPPRYQESFRLMYRDGLTRRQCAVAQGLRSEHISEDQAGIMLYLTAFTVNEIRRLEAEQHDICSDKFKR